MIAHAKPYAGFSLVGGMGLPVTPVRGVSLQKFTGYDEFNLALKPTGRFIGYQWPGNGN